jgi:hypothetical protein
MPARAPAGDFPEPVFDPFTVFAGTSSTPAAIQTDRSETKKNPAYRVALFGAYPSCRIPLAVRLVKFPIIVIHSISRMLHLRNSEPIGSISQASDIF